MLWEQAYGLQITLWKDFYSRDEDDGLEEDAILGNTEIADRLLLHADPIFVTTEIRDLAAEALASWEAQPLLESDLICPNGFVLLEAPILDVTHVEDDDGSTLNGAWWCHAFAWDLEEDVVNLMFWGHGSEVDIEVPYPHVYRAATWPLGDDRAGVPLEASEPTDDLGGIYYQRGLDEDGTYLLEQREGFRWFQVIQTLASQRLTSHTKQRLPRQMRRHPPNPKVTPRSYVTVITLRRLEHRKPTTETQIDWSHRWLVRPHFRNQWYPSLGVHRQILVPAHIKGPDDKELVVSRRAFEFRR